MCASTQEKGAKEQAFVRTKESVWCQFKDFVGGALVDPQIHYITSVIAPCIFSIA